MTLKDILTKERENKYADIFVYSALRSARQLTPSSHIFYDIHDNHKNLHAHNPLRVREVELYNKYEKDIYHNPFDPTKIPETISSISGFFLGITAFPLDILASTYFCAKDELNGKKELLNAQYESKQ